MKCYRNFGSNSTCAQCPLAPACEGQALALSFFSAPAKRAAPAERVESASETLEKEIRATRSAARVWVAKEAGVREAYTSRLIDGEAIAYRVGDSLRICGGDKHPLFGSGYQHNPPLSEGVQVALATDKCRYGVGCISVGDVGTVTEVTGGLYGIKEYKVDFPMRHQGWRGAHGELVLAFPPTTATRAALMSLLG